jgi:hypothetical protein
LAPAKAKGMGASKGFGGKAVVVPAVVADSAPAEKVRTPIRHLNLL